ncbi:MAG: dihydrolipoyl dehydrogenase [Deltaproteobacteria bacterium]|nr:dihydrolipoyl dehydrogenase [Deltaproteobacteria bacterium]
MGSLNQETEVAVIGSGPGGYVAALRLADLGKDVVLIEERERPGGTCLLEGCIPSKSLISAVELAESAKKAKKLGLTFDGLAFDIDALRQWTEGVVNGLSQGVTVLLKRRGVEVLHGRARFSGPRSLLIDGGATVEFEKCIIATGSNVAALPAGMDPTVWTSADALKLPLVPETLLVVGGGYIGLELGLVYAGLGSRVTVVEFFPRLLAGADHDLADVMIGQITPRLEEVLVESRVTSVEPADGGFRVIIEHEGKTREGSYEKVLAAVGRVPNTSELGLENTGVKMDDKGLILTDGSCMTDDPDIFAIGDVTHGPMLAHKASREGKVAAEVIAGKSSQFDNRSIPAVVFTDPEIAWTGMTEREAEERGRKINVGRFPLAALGRARTLGRTDGLVKVISDPDTGLLLGVGMVGPHVSELIAEGSLALEMGATLEDLMVTIHPHPTLSESLMEAAEVAAGTTVHVGRSR